MRTCWYFRVTGSIRSIARLPRNTLLPVCLLFSLATHGMEADGLPVVAPEEVGISSARLGLLTTMLRQHVEDGRVPGLVAAVAREGKLAYLQSLGWQNLEQQTEMQNNSLFQIRSMSKPITAVAVLQLVESGQLALQDPLSDYIAEFQDISVFVDPTNPDSSETRPPSRPITIEDLLLNTAGLSHRNSSLYVQRQVRSRSDTLAELSAKVAQVPLMADPGTQWIYSISTTVLARVVEVISGEQFDDYLREHIYEPLAMHDTAFFVPEDKVERLAEVYRFRSNELTLAAKMAIPITEDPPLLEGAAGIVSTVPDYLRFLQMLLNEGELDGTRILEAETVREMVRNHLPESILPIGFSPNNPMLDLGWGHGLSVVIDENESAYGVNNDEFGWNGSLGTFSWADPETDTIAILMLQIVPSGAHSLSGKFKALVSQSLIDR